MKKVFENNLKQMQVLLSEFTSSFKNGGRSNKWLRTSRCEIYVRANYIASSTELCLASIEIDEKLKNRSMLTELILFIESELEFDIIIVENILSPRLSTFLDRKGFELIHGPSVFGRSSVNAVKKLCST
ncbi:MAG: hypothetical protein GYB58_14900 [Gammaproteobacteria bacterium]|nr:hypothetical protein [Gammaproteobacteria bacterium]